jgi:hypothetical protein
MSTMWMRVSRTGITGGFAGGALPTVRPMATTLLTKRRAVDHCRMHSSLCRMP